MARVYHVYVINSIRKIHNNITFTLYVFAQNIHNSRPRSLYPPISARFPPPVARIWIYYKERKATNYATLLIKSFEALRLNSYLCPAGRWTIGYGHTDGVNQGMLITEKTADAFLRQDIRHAEAEVNRIDADLTQEQFDALVSFVFNVGIQAFRVSTLRKLVERNPNDPKIADEFRRWVYAGDKKLPGLIKRREQEIKLYYS